MTKRINFKIVLSIAFILCVFLTISCKKDDDLEFAGSYSYVMTSKDMPGSQSGNITIKKLSSNLIVINQDDVSDTFYYVSGNLITEAVGQTTEISISSTAKATFQETSTGVLEDNVLTINGTWEKMGYYTINFKVVCTKK